MRASQIDYDQIPSPKSYLSARPPTTNGRGSSALSKSFVPHEPTPDPDLDYADPGAADDFELPQPDDDPPRSPTPEATPEIAAEVEQDAEVEQALVVHSKKVDKGKRRADPVEEGDPSNPDPPDANGLEDDIAQGLEEVENAQDDEDTAPPAKKSKKEQAKPQKPRPERRIVKTPIERAYHAAGACVLDSSVTDSPTPDGVRRGQRHRYKPLDWWRQERVVYGRRDSDLILVPQIKEIIRIPQEPAKPLAKAGKRKRGAGTRSKSKGRDTPFNPEEGWDENTPTNATVIDYTTQEEVSRRKDCIKVEHVREADSKNPPRRCLLGQYDRTQTSRQQQLVFPEDLWGRRVHCGWSNAYTSKVAETKQVYQRQRIRAYNVFFPWLSWSTNVLHRYFM